MKYINYKFTNIILCSQTYYLYFTNNNFIYINFFILIFYYLIYNLFVFINFININNKIINSILINKIKSVNKFDNYIENINTNYFKKTKSISDTNELSEFIFSIN